MKTNMVMLEELHREFFHEKKHVVTEKDIHFIEHVLELNERTILDLRNLRDMTVMYFNMLMGPANSGNTFELAERMSAIVSVIDSKIYNDGGEV